MVHRRFEQCFKSLNLYVADVTAMFFLQALPSLGQYLFVFVRLARTVSGWSHRLETWVTNVKNSILPAFVVSFFLNFSWQNMDLLRKFMNRLFLQYFIIIHNYYNNEVLYYLDVIITNYFNDDQVLQYLDTICNN